QDSTADFFAQQAKPRVRLAVAEPPLDLRVRFVAFLTWEGEVRSVDTLNKTFVAGLTDLASGEAQDTDEATFSLKDVPEPQSDLVVKGARFIWEIGHRYIGRT